MADRDDRPPTQRPNAPVEALSYFFPAHDEAENIEALVEEALAGLGHR